MKTSCDRSFHHLGFIECIPPEIITFNDADVHNYVRSSFLKLCRQRLLCALMFLVKFFFAVNET